MPKDISPKIPFGKTFEFFEYEIILIVFLVLRFAFKNILKFKVFFTEQPVFNLSDNLNILLGVAVLFFVLLISAFFLGRFIRDCEDIYQKPITALVALFLACPASLPFLFSTERVSGTQLLYPFALFIFAIYLARIPIIKWMVPVLCAIYFVPAFHSTEILFSFLHKGSILYVPLIILFLFLLVMEKQLETDKKKVAPDYRSIGLLATTVVFSVGSYVYSYSRGYRWGETLGAMEQKIDLYLLIALLIVSPVLAAFGTILYKAVKGKFPVSVFSIFLRSQVFLLPLFAHNYTGLWVPFLILSLTMLVFYSVKLKNPAILAAVKLVGEYMLERRFAFYIVLIITASLTNVTSTFLSGVAKSVFFALPY